MDKIEFITKLKADFLLGKLSLEEARSNLEDKYSKVTPQEFLECEQNLSSYGIKDEVIEDRINEVLKIFQSVLSTDKLDLDSSHPLMVYIQEIDAVRNVLSNIRSALDDKFIKNVWLGLYDKLDQINIHFSRKQNQLFPILERKNFDMPSKVMWSLDNEIRDTIKQARLLLESDKDKEFLDMQNNVIEKVEDMMQKEEEILLPTSFELITDREFIKMSKGDHEIGFCLIDPPNFYKNDIMIYDNNTQNGDLVSDLLDILKKYGVNDTPSDTLDVAQGKLSLEQINLIFKHLPVDLSFVDENEISKFYSDTKHRVFPRSPEIIGRKVQNCHPRDSVDTVEKIISAFRSGKEDKAEFWLEMNGNFVYIVYIAVRDEYGKFRGVLEMMQDATHIRSLTGSQRLLSWNNESGHSGTYSDDVSSDNEYNINKDTKIIDVFNKYPYIKNYLPTVSPKYERLNNPIVFQTMTKIATIETISQRGHIDTPKLIDMIVEEIKRNEN